MMFNYIKNFKKFILSFTIFNIFNNNNNVIKKDINTIDKNNLITGIIIKNYTYKNNKINLLLLKKIFKEKKKENNKLIYIKNYNLLNNNGYIEQNNLKFRNYLSYNLNYPNIFMNNYKKKQINNLKKSFIFLYKQDNYHKKKNMRYKAYRKITPKKLYFLQSKHSKKTTYHDRLFLRYFNYVNAVKKKKKEITIKRTYLGKLLLGKKKKKEFIFFQNRPKNLYFKIMYKQKKKILLKLNKQYEINFKKYSNEKNIYKKNIILNIWRKFVYKNNELKKRIKYNFSYRRKIFFNKRYLSINVRPKRYFIRFKGRIINPKKILKKNYFHYVKINPKKVSKKNYFYYGKYRYQTSWLKDNKNKIILDKEKLIDSEYYYLDPGLILLKIKLKNISFDYNYFDYLTSSIQDKGFLILFYIFCYIPLIFIIHLIRKEYYKIK